MRQKNEEGKVGESELRVIYFTAKLLRRDNEDVAEKNGRYLLGEKGEKRRRHGAMIERNHLPRDVGESAEKKMWVKIIVDQAKGASGGGQGGGTGERKGNSRQCGCTIGGEPRGLGRKGQKARNDR